VLNRRCREENPVIGQDEIIDGAPWMQSADGVAVWQLACPECGETEIEQGTEPGDGDGVTVHPDGDGAPDSPIGTQGGYAAFRLSCANGHRFTLIVGGHKGGQFIGVVQAGAPAADSNIDIPGTQDPF
jgi:hypothetical protein